MHYGNRSLGWLMLNVMALACCGCGRLNAPDQPAPASSAAPYPRIAAAPGRPAPVTSQTLGAPVELPIDLPTVLRLSAADALEVRLASERLAEAEARRLAADFQFLPTIQPGIGKRWHRGMTQAVTGEFLNVNKEAAQWGAGLAAEWRIGESVFQSLAARRRVAAFEAGVQASQDEARLQAVSAFFSLVLARADQAIIEERIRQADETVRITQAQHEAGAGLLSEAKRAQAARAQVRQRLAAARERVRVASLELTTVLHIDPLVSLVPQQEPQDLLDLVPSGRPLTQLVSDAMANRPELEESRARWNALDEERKAVLIGPLLPTLRADVSKGELGRTFGNTEHSSDYALGLQWAIGRGGIGDVSRTRIARSLQRQEAIRFEQAVDRVAREVIEYHARVETTREQIRLAQEEIAAAQEALRLSRERMLNGAALTIEVLDAEDALASAQQRAAQEVTEFNKAQYGLLRSIGGFRTMGGEPVIK